MNSGHMSVVVIVKGLRVLMSVVVVVKGLRGLMSVIVMAKGFTKRVSWKVPDLSRRTFSWFS